MWLESWQNQGVTTNTAADGKSGSSGVQRYFTLQASSIGITTVQALATAGLPLMNDPHPQNPSLRVRNRDVSQDGPISFSATISYEAQVNDPNDPAQNPLLRPAVIRFSSVTQEVEIDEDVNGDPIQTINDEPIVGVTRPFTDLVITVQRNLPTFNPLSISTYMNKINSATWYGLPAGTVRITDIQAGNVFSEDFEYWDVSVSFQVRRGFGSVTDAKAWWHRTAHQGYIIKNSAGTLKAIAKADPTHDFSTDPNIIRIAETVAQPVMLNLTTGERLAAGVGAYIEFEVLEEIDFNGLNLL